MIVWIMRRKKNEKNFFEEKIMVYVMSFLMLAVSYYLGSIDGIRTHPVISVLLLIVVLIVATIRSSIFL